MGFEPGVVGWKAQTNPLSYGGTPGRLFLQAGINNLIFVYFHWSDPTQRPCGLTFIA